MLDRVEIDAEAQRLFADLRKRYGGFPSGCYVRVVDSELDQCEFIAGELDFDEARERQHDVRTLEQVFALNDDVVSTRQAGSFEGGVRTPRNLCVYVTGLCDGYNESFALLLVRYIEFGEDAGAFSIFATNTCGNDMAVDSTPTSILRRSSAER